MRIGDVVLLTSDHGKGNKLLYTLKKLERRSMQFYQISFLACSKQPQRSLGHQSVRVTEKYYAAWTGSRQRQVEADLQRAWEQDPIVILESKVTRRLRGNIEAVN